MGATLDTGNATWTLEDPLEAFRNLAPYTVSSGIRDSMVWPSENGARVRWTAMGDGCVDLQVHLHRMGTAMPGHTRTNRNHIRLFQEFPISRASSGLPMPLSGRMTFPVSLCFPKKARNSNPSPPLLEWTGKSSTRISTGGTRTQLKVLPRGSIRTEEVLIRIQRIS